MPDTFKDSEIMNMINDSEKSNTSNPFAEQTDDNDGHRNLLVIGCGDGGCNIASAIGQEIPDSLIIAYNTSVRNMNSIRADIKLVPEKEDGSGKSRDYSKEVFKYAHNDLLNAVKKILEGTEIEYIIVTTTTDGGTGSGMSPIAAKLIADNVDVPVVIIGVYPSVENDAMAQYNTLSWQKEVTKTGLPYMLFDNNELLKTGMSVRLTHQKVNSYIVNCMKLISGMLYGNDAVMTVDNRDFFMLIQHIGKRINIATSTLKPTVNQTLDQYVDDMVRNSLQPLPANVGGIAIFLRGNEEMLGKMDVSLPEFRAKYGDAAVHYSHIEVDSDAVQISILTSGSSEPVDRVYEVRDRYDDIMNNQNKLDDVAESMLDNMVNPLGGAVKKKESNPSSGLDLSAFDL